MGNNPPPLSLAQAHPLCKATRFTTSLPPHPPSQVSYNSTIAACAGEDQWQKAVSLLGEMRLVGLAPVSSTFLPAIGACQRAGEGKLAYALTKERDETQRRMRAHPEFRSMKRGQRNRK